MPFAVLSSKMFILLEIATSFLARFYFRNSGVLLGMAVEFEGWPYIEIVGDSKVSIGDYSVIRSRGRRNAIGVNHRAIIRAQNAGAQLIIGKHVGISGASICAKKRVIIGDYCLIGANVVITDNDFHAIKPENRRYNRNSEDVPAEEIVIGNNVWIGANSYILKGVTIGDNSVIGAMAVVTKSIPSNCIAAGNPARVIREL